jgi:DNA-3-methyladenine glycosylase
MIPRSFFQRDPLTCARELIGCELFWGGCSGILVETEAYSVRDDEACHTFFRPSTRRFVREHPPGTAYVYLNYGMYWLLNVLVKGGTEDGFVLIRALEPGAGLEAMQARRGTLDPRKLCSGPGKLTRALAITGADDGRDLCSGAEVGFRLRHGASVLTDVRVGISRAAEHPWRFLLAGSRCVSVPAGKVRRMSAVSKSVSQ